MTPIKERLRFLYEADHAAAHRFRYALLAFDVTTILFIVASSFMDRSIVAATVQTSTQDSTSDWREVGAQVMGEPSPASDRPDHLEIVDILRDDLFSVLFQKKRRPLCRHHTPRAGSVACRNPQDLAVHGLASRRNFPPPAGSEKSSSNCISAAS